MLSKGSLRGPQTRRLSVCPLPDRDDRARNCREPGVFLAAAFADLHETPRSRSAISLTPTPQSCRARHCELAQRRSRKGRPPRTDRISPCRADSRTETTYACQFCIGDSMPGHAHSGCVELARPCASTVGRSARRTPKWSSPRQLWSQWPEAASSRVLHRLDIIVSGRIIVAHR
jgi:hypothetical protein